MDREAIETVVSYKQIREQHFNGGYFSEGVRSEADKVGKLSDEEKFTLFADTFNKVHATAELIQAHPSFRKQENDIDLTDEGLGTITIDLYLYSEEEAICDEDGIDAACRGISIQVDAFSPTPERQSVWINAPGDELGLETSGPTMVQNRLEPRDWGEHIYGGIDGGFRDQNNADIDYEILRLLDAKETLDLVCDKLNIESSSTSES